MIKMGGLRDRMCTFTTADSVVQEILNLKIDDRTLVMCMLWQWWSARNKLNSEGVQLSVEAVVRQARYWASESERFCRSKPSDRQIACRLREQEEWQAPAGDTLKINTDGSFSELTGVGGWGFIVRDKDGTIRGAGAGYLAHVASAAGAEAIAC
jgi:hypothetical protein